MLMLKYFDDDPEFKRWIKRSLWVVLCIGLVTVLIAIPSYNATGTKAALDIGLYRSTVEFGWYDIKVSDSSYLRTPPIYLKR